MVNKNLIQSKSFKMTVQFKANCKKNDFKSEWRASEEEAINDALRHQNDNISHVVEIICKQTQEFKFNVTQDRIERIRNIRLSLEKPVK